MSAFDPRSPEDMTGSMLAGRLSERLERDRQWRRRQVKQGRMHPHVAARLDAIDAEILNRLRASDGITTRAAA